MIRNRYNSLTPSVPRHQREKKDALKVTAPQSKHYKQKAKKKVFPRKWPYGYQKKKKKKKKKKNASRQTCKDIQ